MNFLCAYLSSWEKILQKFVSQGRHFAVAHNLILFNSRIIIIHDHVSLDFPS